MAGALVAGSSVTALGTVLHVPSQYPTIQAGIDAAVNGDTVLVANGSYTGDGNRDIDFLGKSIVVMSENGPQVTIINCQGSSMDPHRGFCFHSGEQSSSVLQGFTIRNGYSIGDEYGGGIACLGGASPTIAGNAIAANTAVCGGGIHCDSSAALIEGNAISGNTATWGGGINLDRSPAMITGNLVTANAADSGGGIFCVMIPPTIEGNTIIGNTADFGGGVYWLVPIWELQWAGPAPWDRGGRGRELGEERRWISHDSSILAGNRICGNTAQFGAGLYLWGPTPDVIGNLVTGNTAQYVGGGISCNKYCETVIAGNTIAGNEALYGGGISCEFWAAPTVLNSISWENTAPTGSEIYVGEGSSIGVTYSDVEGGWPGEGNIDENPSFVLAGKRDHRLLWESPCIDAGHPDSLDPDGTRSDMGAFFFDQDDYLTLYLTPDTTVVLPGSELGVTYTAINRWGQPEPFWVLTEAVVSSGDTVRVVGPDQYTLPADFTVQRHLTHRVPSAAPFGEYRYRSRIGTPPATLYDEDSFSFEIAPVCDYLIWDADLTPFSGQPIMDALSALGRSSEFVEGPPGNYDLFAYRGLFICLGVYPNNAMIMEGSPEALQIEEYIAAGGSVYLEGGDVWYYDPLVGGHDFGPSFGIIAVTGGSPLMGLLSGVPNSLMPGLAGLTSPYFAANAFFDWLGAIPPAEIIFTMLDMPPDVGVANPTATGGHTIGVSFELGGTTFVEEVVGEFVVFFEG
ncbi:hypothetical protein AMJ39_05215 [candidate division TA06 bacterium DG_24]|uniref:Right handed beta helix domain-containing protein n=2 Tax=Bacteria division TA06 TaxID=1156500 RepID=A0A0S8FZI2_UNCT6|nr:MAG: hypothetical protein AMJ39_05215 [candidate division TA06 bacterium DG_24]KPK66083.1 MAG: hypothetical protein AMJ82_12075 [candidate division TA06 bacterium SM23_40]